MAKSAVTGFLLAALVFFGSVALALSDFTSIIDSRSILIVFGGTISVSIICFPASKIFMLFKIFLRGVLGLNEFDYLGLIDDMVVLAKENLKGRRNFETAVEKVSHPFLKDGGEVLFWSESNISVAELRDLLETAAETHFHTYTNQANMFKTIAKFPPAFGLLGTTLGMIGLLQSLGSEASIDNLGPAMAVALITTLYGLAVANFIFTPIAINLNRSTAEDFLARRMIVEGLILIQQQKPAMYVEAKLRAYLLPSQKGDKDKK